jgi:N-acetylglucosamine-6-sulfatase
MPPFADPTPTRTSLMSLGAFAAATAMALGAAKPSPALAAPAPSAARPNVVVVMTDDQDFRSMSTLPNVRKLIGDRGTQFTTSLVNYPLCGPSRSTFLSGEYAHNHHVEWNQPPQGGYEKFDGRQTLPVWMHRAGYRTIHIGKYINDYGLADPTEIPKGWDDWHGTVDPSTYHYYGTTFNDNGHLHTYGHKASDYSVDVAARKAEQAISSATRRHKPFFLNIAPIAPHTLAEGAKAEGTPAVPAPRYAKVFANTPLPRYPDFNEADISDKPPTLQAFFPNLLTAQQISDLTEHYRGRMGSLLAVNDLVGGVIKRLKQTHQYRNTVVIFTSDNGWILGEHRLNDPITETGMASGAKYVPYDGSSRVPLYMAGPGVPRGRKISGPVVNADLPATILGFAHAKATRPLDGMNLVPVLKQPSLLDGRGVLIETGANPRNLPTYIAVRTERYRYELEDDGLEGFYDLEKDPWEMTSIPNDPRYAKIKAILRRAALKLQHCKGKSCQVNVGKLPQPGA